MADTIKVQVTLDTAVADKLDALAASMGLPRSSIVTISINELFRAHPCKISEKGDSAEA